MLNRSHLFPRQTHRCFVVSSLCKHRTTCCYRRPIFHSTGKYSSQGYRTSILTHIAKLHMEMDNIAAPSRFEGVTLDELPKSSVFTKSLTPDPNFPTPESAAKAPRVKLGPRQVREAMFTWVTPEGGEERPELLAISESAMKELGLKLSEKDNPDFVQLMAGNTVSKEVMPWAACYGGWQFGQWAGQLGDGRAISLFEATNPHTKKRYEVQLKGAGLTPYSRFADGKAVVRSSIREFVVSEALHALGIPTTRALALTLLPSKKAVRERVEPCAIVCRFAPSWIRIGNFDIFRWRGDRKNLRLLADYVIRECFGGEDKMVPPRPEEQEWEGLEQVNRYQRMYREIVRRNARTVAKWQCFGFMNGVLNTDNTHIMGLSLDFGPFSFMDNYDPNFTPNHDDHMRRYSYQNQPTVIWWNLVRLAEDIAELYAVGSRVDDPNYIENGLSADDIENLIPRAEKIIERAGEEYKYEFQEEYCATMGARLGLLTKLPDHGDIATIISPTLEMLKDLELDFNHFFRVLSKVPILRMETKEEWLEAAKTFLQPDEGDYGGKTEEEARMVLAEWLGGMYRTRLQIEAEKGMGRSDEERIEAMLRVNPHFIPRSWILQEVIDEVEHRRDRQILSGLMKMVLNPFEESWDWNDSIERRWCGPPPRFERGLQCSCSS